MHARLADRRVNRVNLRREFFYATPAEARDLLTNSPATFCSSTNSPKPWSSTRAT